MTETPLDAAHARMETAAEDPAARLAFYDRLAAAELFLLLEAEPEGDRVEPAAFPVEGALYVLAFDRADRLTTFTGQASPYAALSGRALAAMLAGQGLGLGLNLSVAPSSILLPAEALDWLAGTLAGEARETADRPVAAEAPADLPEGLLAALDARLAAATGLAVAAWLAAVRYGDGHRGHLLAFVDPCPGAEAALTRTVGEALAFSGVEAGWLDVGFFGATDPVVERLARIGLRFDLPTLPDPQAPTAPGRDPDRPPMLR